MNKILKTASVIITAAVISLLLVSVTFAAKEEGAITLSAKNAQDGISLSWTELKGATSYHVYRKTDESKKWKKIAKTKGNTLSYTDKKVSIKRNYTYMVKAYSDGKLSCTSEYIKTDFTRPVKITKFTSNIKNIRIAWQKDTKAKAYEIYRTDADGKKLKLYKTVSSDTLKLIDKNVTVNKKYGYAVRTINKNGKKSALTKAQYCILMKVPEITGAENTTAGIKISWSKTPSAQSYNLYRREIGSDTWKKILSTERLSATDKSALNGKKYAYTVRAVYNGIQSAYSKKDFTACFLSAPEDVTVEYVTKTSNRISWAANRGATAYNIYRRKENSTEWTRIKRTSKTSYTDKSVKAGTVYSYFVRAYINTDYKSAASTTVYSNLINPKGKLIALTYDDGPSSIITSRILDTLEKHGARATFFVVGSRIAANCEPLKRAVSLGCEIGNHTYSHINLPTCDESDIIKEISSTNKLVKKYTGFTPVLARAPGGSTSEHSRSAVNMPFIYWSIDTRDWETRNSKTIIAHIKDGVRDGSIILMHDIYEATADATEIIVPWLIEEGYQPVTVSELMRYRDIELKKGVTYYNAYA